MVDEFEDDGSDHGRDDDPWAAVAPGTAVSVPDPTARSDSRDEDDPWASAVPGVGSSPRRGPAAEGEGWARADRRATGKSTSDSHGRRAAPEADGEVDPAAERRRATDICYALLTARARTRVELRDALARKGIGPGTAEDVLGRFDRAGLIDDAAFAEVWVRSRHTHHGLGRRALARELRQKGVSDEVAAEAVAAVDEDAERERARELVRKKLRAMSALDDRTKLRRLVAALARKGYAEGLAYRVVRDELQDVDDEPFPD
ncbi:hypothetical protein GCM10022243_16240 [Saccharothrix violaceirubra]